MTTHGHPTAGRCRAFTLIEILVATAAIAVLLIALYGLFSRGIRLRDEAVERTREVRLRARAAAVLTSDLRHGLVTGGRLAATLTGSPQASESRFPGVLRFTTTTGPTFTNAFYGDLQQVDYYVAEDPFSTNQNAGVLIRALDRHLLASLRQSDREERLLERVTSLEVSFYDGGNWVDSWEYADTNSPLPVAVQVRIQQAAAELDDPQPLPLEVVVPWPVQATNLLFTASTNSAAGAGGDDTTPPPAGGGGGGGGGGSGGPTPPTGSGGAERL